MLTVMTPAPSTPRPVTPAALGAFCVFAALMAAFAAQTLLAPGGPLDALWRIKPAEHAQLLAMGPRVGLGFCALSVAAVVVSVGVFRRRRWAWWAAIAALLANATGDAARALTGAWIEGGVGVAITGAIVWWLTRPRVRALFDR